MEAARLLGFANRFVTGYLYDSSTDPGSHAADDPAVSGGGSTHAWANVFIPGAGWVEFDPTNRIVAGHNLIRITTTRSPGQAIPASGTYPTTAQAFWRWMPRSASAESTDRPGKKAGRLA